MKILISSLQVSDSSSKGHLHPAIEIALALKARGHEVALLPLPCPLNEEDITQLKNYQIELFPPPVLPPTLPFSKEKLEMLAINPETTHLAYESFLMTPLPYQFDAVLQKMREWKPDILVYDLLVYTAPLAARKIGLKEIGFCAGLKLIAPDSLTKIYQTTAKKLAPTLKDYIEKIDIKADFHHLELLSLTQQMVFTSKNFINAQNINYPQGTILMEPLPIHPARITTELPETLLEKAKNAVILSFGSVYDPASFPHITDIIIKVSQYFNLRLFIVSKRLSHLNTNHCTVMPHLPLPRLMTQAAIFIHHGGANTFYEALALGAKQILIPLATDQPIQAELLKASKGGISLYPHEINESIILEAFTRLLNPDDEIHRYIAKNRALFANGKGAENAVNLIEGILSVEDKRAEFKRSTAIPYTKNMCGLHQE